MVWTRTTLAAALLLWPSIVHASTHCDDAGSPPTRMGSESSTIGSKDIAGLRDIGPTPSLLLGESPLAVSPDGNFVAFQTKQAIPETNSFCLAMMVMKIDSSSPPISIDTGDTLKRFTFKRGTLAGYPSGEAELIRPQWSSDGKLIAYLKIIDGRTQIQVTSIDGTFRRTLGLKDNDVINFRWAAKKGRLIATLRPTTSEAQQSIVREGLKGYLYDDRWAPIGSNRPWPSTDAAFTAVEFAVESGDHVLTEGPEARELDSPLAVEGAKRLRAVAGASEAWLEPDISEMTYSTGKLRVTLAGHQLTCRGESCSGSITGIWLASSGRTVLFSRREGWANNETAVYIWDLRSPKPHRLYKSRDLLIGCQMVTTRLLCLREASLRPRHIIAIDTRSGKIGLIYDPNPDFQRMRLPSVERIYLRSKMGSEVFSDLVLPPGYDGHSRLPLVIVQYDSRGFLRGGTGDEYPIIPLASAGFAVLSFNRPPNLGPRTPGTTIADIERLGHNEWADKRNVLSAIERAVKSLTDRGIVDPARVGITGLSDGSSTLQFAIANTRMFAAAASSTCCEDPGTLFPILGLNESDWLRGNGYPDYTDRKSNFWNAYSPSLNAGTITTPLLMQSADDEYLGALAAFTALREHNVPTDLYVFPDEHHTKWQPAHKLAVYERNIAWFTFWLKPDAASAALSSPEQQRWWSMREKWMSTKRDLKVDSNAPLNQAITPPPSP